jgi:hypothetical protein
MSCRRGQWRLSHRPCPHPKLVRELPVAGRATVYLSTRERRRELRARQRTSSGDDSIRLFQPCDLEPDAQSLERPRCHHFRYHAGRLGAWSGNERARLAGPSRMGRAGIEPATLGLRVDAGGFGRSREVSRIRTVEPRCLGCSGSGSSLVVDPVLTRIVAHRANNLCSLDGTVPHLQVGLSADRA